MADDAEGKGGPLPLDLLEVGDPAFVEAIRSTHDAEALADFAARWFEDRRPASRQLLLDYLDRPLNAFRHEGLVKRLFKRAEAAGDDEVMGRFLVLFDRSVRRVRVTRRTWTWLEFATEGEALSVARSWRDLGYTGVYSWSQQDRFRVGGFRPDQVIRYPRRTTMPRGKMVPDRTYRWLGPRLTTDWAAALKITRGVQADLTPPADLGARLGKFRLFSPPTRRYLRRRAWRHFRRLGKEHPGRYVAAVSKALALYRDEDAADGLALLDNWGLVQILFHHSPALESRPIGWDLKAGHSLADLAPAPIFGAAWDEAPAEVVGLLAVARCRAVRTWAIRRSAADPARSLASVPIETWFGLLGHDDPEVAALAARMLGSAGGLDAIEPARWLGLAESAAPAALEMICELIGRHLGPDRVTLEQAARLAGLRPIPAARLGLDWLQAKGPKAGEADRVLLGLVEAGCEPLRPEILRWVCEVLSDSGPADPASILEFLDSRHADARAEGWLWFLAEPSARDDRETWRKLLESPYDDVRLPLVAELERREAAGPGGDDDPEALRALWASVLLNVHRGSRARPAVVAQIVRRLEARPDLAPALLPLLGLALRSARPAERRAGLVAVVRLVEGRSEVGPLARASFPELQWA